MSDGESEPNPYIDGEAVEARKLIQAEQAKGEPVQHLSLTRLTFEADCRVCYEFWINYHDTGAFLNIETALAYMKKGAERGHWGQHIFAVEERLRKEYIEARRAYYTQHPIQAEKILFHGQ